MHPASTRSLASLRAIMARQARPIPQLAARHALRPRYVSTEAPTPRKGSPSTGFYKMFGRPIAEVLLMAVFTYQLAYYFWVWAEQKETKGQIQDTISDLEKRIEELENKKKSKN